jgi:hypothetical protein
MSRTRFAFLAAAVAVALSLGSTALAQQAPPTGGPRPGGGFGFTHAPMADWNDHSGWTQIFDGKSLDKWDYIPGHWSVEDGAIVGKSSDANPAGTTNIIWRGGTPANFRMRFEFKLEGNAANGGFQYRGKSQPLPERTMDPARLAAMTPEMKARMEKAAELNKKNEKWAMVGYQADFDAANRYTGQLYDAGSTRGIVAWRGDVVAAGSDSKVTKLASLGTEEELKAFIKPLGEWNQMEVIADGNVLTHILNGHVTAIVIDNDPKRFAASGVIAFELEGSGDVKISQRNIYMMPLP